MIRILRDVYRAGRKMLFTKDKPDGPFIVVDENISDLERKFGEHHFGPNWNLSYNFKGENLNLATVFWEYTPEHPGIVWWQIHVRGWVLGDGTIQLRGHFEAEPSEHPSEHLDGVGYDVERGMAAVREVLDE